MILGSSKNPVTLIGQVEPTNFKRVIPRPHAGLNSKGFSCVTWRCCCCYLFDVVIVVVIVYLTLLLLLLFI